MRKIRYRRIAIFTALMMLISVLWTAVPAAAASTESRIAGTAEASAAADAGESTAASYAGDEILAVTEDSVSNAEIRDLADENGDSCEAITKVDDCKMAVVKLDEDTTPAAAADDYGSEDQVLYAQPNYRYRLSGSSTDSDADGKEAASGSETASDSASTASGTAADSEPAAEEPDDPYLNASSTSDYYENYNDSAQWYLWRIRAPQAWRKMTHKNDRSVKVGVIDTGVVRQHKDLQQAVAGTKRVETRELTQNAYKKNGKGSGLNKYTYQDPSGHGTHVCGLIAAETDNGCGIAGASYNCVSLYVADAADDESFYTSDLVKAMNWLQQKQVQVINMSLGMPGYDRLMETKIHSLSEAGIVCVAAAGNVKSQGRNSPSDASEVISVIAAGHSRLTEANSEYAANSMASYSNYGSSKDLMAPGGALTKNGHDPNGLCSTWNTGTTAYHYESGTSMAAPLVTATAAMVIAEGGEALGSGSAFVRRVRNLLCNAAELKEGVDFHPQRGFGMLNAEEAVTLAQQAAESGLQAAPTALLTGRDSVTVYPGQTAAIKYKVIPGNADAAQVTWTSADPAVATVSSDGVISGKKEGKTTVTAVVGSVRRIFSVSVGAGAQPMSTKPQRIRGSLTLTDQVAEMRHNKALNLQTTYADVYRFRLTKGQRLRCCMQSPSSGISCLLLLFDSRGRLRSVGRVNNDDLYCRLSYKAAKSDSYYLEASHVLAACVDVSDREILGSYTLYSTSASQKVKSIRVKKRGRNTIVLAWQAPSSAAGLRCRVDLCNAEKKKISTKTTGTDGITLSHLRRRSTYYVRVRPYLNAQGGRLYGGTSNYVKVQTR
ncbi:MAG: S8 family serine peptidase [Anaerovoracaceae bacterium]|jgi:hypothetical protein